MPHRLPLRMNCKRIKFIIKKICIPKTITLTYGVRTAFQQRKQSRLLGLQFGNFPIEAINFSSIILHLCVFVDYTAEQQLNRSPAVYFYNQSINQTKKGKYLSYIFLCVSSCIAQKEAKRRRSSSNAAVHTK